ncbi:hypothetical protein [Lysobacter sp. FW306-1B-D06B]|uniref:DUF6630 family protein n=1 Tax=Lysobacter sp. FW306-1B-D06B TaxID=3140250 RepID=UPI003140C536
MHSEYDPDDNFARAFHNEADIDDEAAMEAVAWQFLLLINPGDDEAAMEQFNACREALADGADPVAVLRDVIDWRSGFYIDDTDPAGLVEVLDELASRLGLRIDWGEDTDEDEFLAHAEVPALVNVAFDRLREHHYTLWTYETGESAQAGFITRQRDDEALRMVAGALGFHVRTGAL